MEPLILSILGLAGSVKTIMTILMVLGFLLIANIVVLILTRRDRPKRPSPLEGHSEPKVTPAASDQAAISPETTAFISGLGRSRRFLAGLGILAALLTAAVALADLFFFESLTRQALGRLTHKAGIQIDFSSARGSFWTGKFNFTDLTAKRPEHPGSVFDLRVASAEVDISMGALLRRRIVFDKLEIKGVEGSLEQRTRAEKEAWSPSKLTGGKGGGKAGRRPFRIDHFKLNDGRLSYSNLALDKPFSTELRLDYLQASPLQSDRLLFNLLFTGGARGALSGLDFTIDPQASGEGRQSIWRFHNLPLPVLGSLVGGPLEWFERGLADIVVENQAAPGAEGGTAATWNLTLRDFQVEAPAGTSRLIQMAAAPTVAYLNSKSERLELSLDLELQPEDLRFSSTSELAILIGTALSRSLSQKFEDLKSNIVEGTVNRAKRSLFNRKGPDQGETPEMPEPAPETAGPNSDLND